MVDRLPPAAPLPGDALALHIGIHKTGTTALQAALADARPELATYGVLYPGRRAAQHGAAMAVLERPWGWSGKGGTSPYPRVFERVAHQARRHKGRVVISSEGFCEADDHAADRTITGFGPDRTYVIVALRNLGRLLYSSWQQYLKYGRTTPYERWLEAILDPDHDGRVTPNFWMRNDHGALIERWARLVGPERVKVLVLEDVPPEALFVAFEELLGLPPGTLTSRIRLSPNRSMTPSEAEVLRRLNRSLKDSLDWRDYEDLVRNGIASAIVSGRVPGEEDPRPHTPDWALDAAAARALRDVERIRASGVAVLGNLDALSVRLESAPPIPKGTLDQLPTDAVVEVLASAVLARAGRTGPWDPKDPLRRLRNQVARRIPVR